MQPATPALVITHPNGTTVTLGSHPVFDEILKTLTPVLTQVLTALLLGLLAGGTPAPPAGG